MNCEYGCGNIAKFKTKNGKNICEKYATQCPKNKEKNKKGLKKSYENRSVWNKGLEFDYGMRWENKTEKEIKEIHKKSGRTLSLKIEKGEITPSFSGRKHSNKSKEKISSKMAEKNNGIIRTKYYQVFCPMIKINVNVQGTWERDFAHYLNERGIKWLRNRKLNLRYKLNEEDYNHIYYPDFYLPEYKCYVEIKGYWFKSDDGRVDDKRKMKCVIEQNKEIEIIIFDKYEKWKNYSW